MKSRKGLLVLAIVLFGGLFFAFKTSGIGSKDIIIPQKQRLLAEVGRILEEQHYSPKNINDDFSKKVFKKYLEELDGDKSQFLLSDITALKKYENSIDEEIRGTAPLEFTNAVNGIYDKRINEVMDVYREILAKPFDFTKDESAILDGEKLAYVVTAEERKERWRKKLKYLTLERYSELIDEREKNKEVKDFVVKADSTLERISREKVLKIMNDTYLRIQKTFTEDQRFNSFINVITNLMDPHSDYFPPQEKRAFDERMSGSFFGIGAQLQKDDYGVKIASVVAGGPAYKSGEIVAGDIIVKVAQGKDEPVDITGYETTDAVLLIRGNKGTEVRLTIKKQDGTIKVVSMIREKIEQDELNARSAIITKGKEKIGYIWLQDFYANFDDINSHRCSEDVAKEVIKLKAENVSGIVIDIRNNGGGSLYEVVKMVGLFIKNGPVVQVKERSGKVDQSTWKDEDPSVLYDGPLAVMVNEFSASASEIFAGAIQDYKRGIIIGSTSTYGKGTVQKQIPFGNRNDQFSGRTDMGAMTLTFQKFYRVNGGSTQLKGITPDVILPDTYEYYKGREKDNVEALPYDEIPKASYQLWPDNAGFESIVKKENEKIKSNASLNLLTSNLQWLAKNAELPVTLNLEKYKAHQKQVISTVNQNNTLLKIQQDMNVEPVTIDKERLLNNPNQQKAEYYKLWFKALKSDMHIDETVNMVSELSKTRVQTVLK